MTSTAYTPPSCAHTMDYRVSYADTDQMGRIYYGRYFELFERSRTELLRAADWPYQKLEQDGFWLPVRQCSARYHAFAAYDEELALSSWVERMRNATISVTTTVWRPTDQRLLVTGQIELACITAEGRPQALPDGLRARLTDYIATDA